MIFRHSYCQICMLNSLQTLSPSVSLNYFLSLSLSLSFFLSLSLSVSLSLTPPLSLSLSGAQHSVRQNSSELLVAAPPHQVRPKRTSGPRGGCERVSTPHTHTHTHTHCHKLIHKNIDTETYKTTLTSSAGYPGSHTEPHTCFTSELCTHACLAHTWCIM